MTYTFSTLFPADFEDLARDLLGRELGLRFEAFGPGPDGGIDGRHAAAGGPMILQAKHYAGSSFSALAAQMKKERKAIDRLSPARYLLATSKELSPFSYRQLEEMMEEHGVEVNHATLNRWVVKYVPLLEREFRARKQPVGSSWRLDETYVRVKGSWRYLYRAVDKAGATVDFLLTAKRDRKAALRFLCKAIKCNGTPEKITIAKSGANTAAIESHTGETGAGIEIRQIKYLNNIIEQDHRAIKRLIRPMLGFKSFRSAAVTLAGIELIHMIRKGQLLPMGEVRPAQQFYSLAG